MPTLGFSVQISVFIMEETRNWGGKRAGAGRKRVEGSKHYSFTASREVAEVLDAVEGPRSTFICRCILEHAQREI